MVLRLYNTLTRKKEIFKPINKNEVKVYVCGPTVNDVPHLGHARSQISFDILRRYLKFLEYNVKFASNITDIEDKIINKANELKISVKELTEKNIKEHLEDYKKLGISRPDVQPKATEYIPQMIELIKLLEKKGYAYKKEDGIYFKISNFKNYGELSHQNIKNLELGKRIKEKSDNDFVLWKFSKTGEPFWDSPWGKGRPGWHIECSAMSNAIFGLPFDIHGGGQDLIFPHHEDEIAQSEAGYGKKFVNYWVHNGMINVDKIKMSKSLGNFRTIKDILKNYSGEIIRYFVILNQYRKPIDFSYKNMENAKISYEKLKNICSGFKDDKKINKKYLWEFEKTMNDDLNTPKALQILWKLVRDEKAKGKYLTIKKMDEVFGLNLLKKEKIEIPNEIRKLIEEREEARKNKEWKKADEIRNKINKLNFVIEDTKEGVIIKKGEN
jgi:cysteinyl-tRNA synthetase